MPNTLSKSSATSVSEILIPTSKEILFTDTVDQCTYLYCTDLLPFSTTSTLDQLPSTVTSNDELLSNFTEFV